MTQLELARQGIVSEVMVRVAQREGVEVELIRQGLADGTIVIPHNRRRHIPQPCAIGQGLRIKVNALIGTSGERNNPEEEKQKILTAVSAGADTIMDLSTGGDIAAMRRLSLATAPVPVGTVPIYEAAIRAINEKGSIVAMTADDMLNVIEEQAAAGVDFMAIHCAFNLQMVKILQNSNRITDIVSRGGAFLAAWMIHNQQENPLFEHFDRVLSILQKYDVTLSLGDAARPGSTADSLDALQIYGLSIAGELVQRARTAGVQVMVEGPGHVPLHHVVTTIKLQKRLCHNAPYFILGTLAIDCAPGYDHITAAIGGALAGLAGADFICCVTPAEHLGLPTADDIYQGVMAARTAAHAADIARQQPQALTITRSLHNALRQQTGPKGEWQQHCLDPSAIDRYYSRHNGHLTCHRCGELCAYQIVQRYLAG